MYPILSLFTSYSFPLLPVNFQDFSVRGGASTLGGSGSTITSLKSVSIGTSIQAGVIHFLPSLTKKVNPPVLLQVCALLR